MGRPHRPQENRCPRSPSPLTLREWAEGSVREDGGSEASRQGSYSEEFLQSPSFVSEARLSTSF